MTHIDSEGGHGLAVGALVHNVGLMLHVPGLLAVAVLPVVVITGEWFALPGFAALAVASPLLGQLAVRASRSPGPTKTLDALAAVALGWLLCAALAAVPLWAAAEIGGSRSGAAAVYGQPVHALFEAMSGLTSTGLTMVSQEGSLPRALQWWRTLLQWVGGVGVIVLVAAATGQLAGEQALYEAEARSRTIGKGVRRTAWRIWLMFCVLTAASVVALLAAGAEPWVALNHGMTGIATGGFVVTDQSFVEAPAAVKLVALVVMIVGAVSFVQLHRLASDRDWRSLLRSTQIRALAVGLVVCISATVVATSVGPEDPALLDAVFQAVSALATCGFASEDPSGWGPAATMVLTAAMIVGGSAGSTTGGLKLARAAWLIKAALAEVSNGLRPIGGRATISYDGDEVSPERASAAISHAAGLAVLWLASLGAGTLALVLMLPDSSAGEVGFEAASALGSVGLTTGITGPSLPLGAELTLIALMWLGRLEIVAVLVLLLAPFIAARRREPSDA